MARILLILVLTITKQILVSGQDSTTNLAAVLSNVSLQFTGLSKCVINLNRFNTKLLHTFWGDVISYIIQLNMDNLWILDDDSNENVTVFPVFQNTKTIQMRGHCAITIILNLLESDTAKRHHLMFYHPNLSVGTYTHSTLLFVTLEFPNAKYLSNIDSIRDVRTFFIHIQLTNHSFFFEDHHLRSQVFYICPYCQWVYIQVPPGRLRRISPSFYTFSKIWHPVSFASNYRIGNKEVKNCGDTRARKGYTCFSNFKRLATLSKILNVSFVDIPDNGMVWYYGSIELATNTQFYEHYMSNRLYFQRELG